MKRIKILYFCGYPPLPLVSGNRHRIYHIGRLLQKYGSVTLGIISQFEFDASKQEGTRDEFGDFIFMSASEVPDRSIVGKARRFLNKKRVECRNYSINRTNRTFLEEMASQHDVVWIHTLEVADMIGRYYWHRCVLDIDDLNQVKHSLAARVEKSKWYMITEWYRAALWRRWERDALNRFDVITVCSEEDKALLGESDRVHVVPNGFDVPEEKPELKLRDGQWLGLIGNFEYFPNREGLMWFVKEVFPLVLSKAPRARLRVVGRLPGDVTVPAHPNVDILGFVDDYASEMDQWSASLVPLRIGGGTRIKILDAFSRLCPIVSTNIGAYGLGVEDGRELLLADTAQEFAKACLKLMFQPESARSLVENGWDTVTSRFAWNKQILMNVKQALQHCISMI